MLKVLLQPPLPSPPVTGIWVADAPFLFLSVPYPFFVIAISWNLVLHSQKKLQNIHKIVKKVYCDKAVTRTQMRAIIKKAKEGKPAAADHRQLHAKTFITNIVPEVENDQGESARKLAQAPGMPIKMTHATLHRIWTRQEVGLVGDQTALKGDEEGTIKNMRGNHSDDRLGFLTIWDNVLTVGESAGDEEQAGLPH